MQKYIAPTALLLRVDWRLRDEPGRCAGMVEILLQQLASVTPLEAAGLGFGLAAVVLLIRENIWTWPCGLAYVACSLVLFWRGALYGQFVLHLFFGAMNAYGWWYWLRGSSAARDAGGELRVSHASRLVLTTAIALAIGGGLGAAWLSDLYTDAAVPYWDDLITSFSFLAMWLSARKHIENWYLWLAIDVCVTPMYYSQGLYLYALLYLIYVPMAWMGYLNWRDNLVVAATPYPTSS